MKASLQDELNESIEVDIKSKGTISATTGHLWVGPV